MSVKKVTPRVLRKFREDNNLTQAEAGELLLASRRAWQSWELGAQPMPALKQRVVLFLVNRGVEEWKRFFL